MILNITFTIIYQCFLLYCHKKEQKQNKTKQNNTHNSSFKLNITYYQDVYMKNFAKKVLLARDDFYFFLG